MAIIEWNVSFYTGLPEVDQQHNRLVALANRLSEISVEDQAVMDEAFLELKAYVVEHFSLEERLMDEAMINSEHQQSHKNAHSMFVAKLGQLWEGRDDSGRTLDEMLGFLKVWIIQHILQTDRKMALEIHDKLGTGAPHNMFTHF